MPRRYCVTGAAGCLGRAVVAEVLAAGETCRVLVRQARKFSALLEAEGGPREQRSAAENLDSGQVEVIEGSCDDPAVLRQALADVDAVIHCAAGPATPAAWKEREERDLVMLAALLEAARQGRPHVVLPSTVLVYGVPLVSPIPETHRLAEENLGARGKLRQEALLRQAAASAALPCSILRFPEILGPGFHGERMRRLFRDALDGTTLTGYGNPALRTEFLHARDAARACLAMERRPDPSPRVYNVPGPEPLAWQAWYDLVRQCAGSAAGIIFIPLPLLRKERWFRSQEHCAHLFAYEVLLDGAAFRRDFHFQHAFDNRAIAESTLAWLRRMPTTPAAPPGSAPRGIDLLERQGQAP
ncbi:MAG: NAD(P)-dependent oxidoreductase [Candidatus Tectomicrobia bacterium]|nr:NAD(P)-dependent oxidoreductase [Candidatus Tectomicrobia bacterium]